MARASSAHLLDLPAFLDFSYSFDTHSAATTQTLPVSHCLLHRTAPLKQHDPALAMHPRMETHTPRYTREQDITVRHSPPDCNANTSSTVATLPIASPSSQTSSTPGNESGRLNSSFVARPGGIRPRPACGGAVCGQVKWSAPLHSHFA